MPDGKDNGSVKLFMLKDSWTELKTEKTGPGTYKAYTRGFGSFAIAGTHAQLSQVPAEVLTSSTVSPTITISAESMPQKQVNLVLILILLAVLTVMVYFLKKLKTQE